MQCVRVCAGHRRGAGLRTAERGVLLPRARGERENLCRHCGSSATRVAALTHTRVLSRPASGLRPPDVRVSVPYCGRIHVLNVE